MPDREFTTAMSELDQAFFTLLQTIHGHGAIMLQDPFGRSFTMRIIHPRKAAGQVQACCAVRNVNCNNVHICISPLAETAS